jgi:FAD/FMN-containing dehydrogenase/ferredoxin
VADSGGIAHVTSPVEQTWKGMHDITGTSGLPACLLCYLRPTGAMSRRHELARIDLDGEGGSERLGEEPILALARALAAALSDDAEVITNAPERAIYSRDLAELPRLLERTLFRTTPDLVVRPATSEDVAQTLQFAHTHDLPVTPRGLASSAYGGAVPTRGGIVLDMLSLKGMGRPDAAALTVHVAAGARWGDLDAQLAKHGLALYTYPSSRFSTVAGWVATGGYGINSFKYGHFSRWVEALQVVDPDGTPHTVTHVDPEFQLYFGSEGQLGAITGVTLRVRHKPEIERPYLLYFDSLAETFAFVNSLALSGIQPAHLKVIDRQQMANINRLHAEAHPHGRPLVAERDALFLLFDDAENEAAFATFPLPRDEAPRHVAGAIWHERFFPMKVKRLGPALLASQVVMPVRDAANFLDEVGRLGQRFGVQIGSETYILDGEGEPRALIMAWFTCSTQRASYLLHLPLVQMITRLGLKRGGAPYGAGIWNAPFNRAKFGEKWQALKASKRRLDPAGRFNPGKFPGVRSRLANLPGLLFHPSLFRVVTDVALRTAPVLGSAARLLNRVGRGNIAVPLAHTEFSPGGENGGMTAELLEATVLGCTACGDCVPVCPAYLVTGDETVTGRAKLRTALKLIRGDEVTPLESDKTFLCMYCKACQDVCQSNLPLIRAYEETEHRLAERFGRPDELIQAFIAEAESRRDYYEFIGTQPFPLPEPELPTDIIRLAQATPERAAEPASAPEGAEHRDWKYHIEPVPVASRREAVGKFLILRDVDICINCGQCERACIYGVHSRDPFDVRKMAEPESALCRNCFRCVQECPRLALSMDFDPAYAELGRGVYTPDVVASLAKQAERGQIPVLGAGYRGAFSGPGFDGMWTDMSEIIRPTRDGIHGRETISTAIDLGRRPESLRFDERGNLLTDLPPTLELPLPIMLTPPDGAAAPAVVADALVRAAQRLGTLALVRPADWQPEWEAYREAVALRVTPDEVDTAAELLRRVRLVEIEAVERGDMQRAISRIKERQPEAVVAVRLAMDERAPAAVEVLCRDGVEVVHLVAPDGLEDAQAALVMTERLPLVHRRLVEARIRDQITLVASGAVTVAEHVPKAIILGADGVMIDWPLWAALECRLNTDACRSGGCACGPESIDPAWGAQRIVNLMASWHSQLLEVLGAMGLREVRRLRGERGRAMFAREMEEKVFIPLAAVVDDRQQTTDDSQPSVVRRAKRSPVVQNPLPAEGK